MLYWSAAFLVISVTAGILGLGESAGTAFNIAWIISVLGLILAVTLGVIGRTRRSHRRRSTLDISY
jgi:uncharacterized membrane protein YtjA (UPF0391 family)